MKMKTTKDIDAYISDFPEDIQKILKKMRETIRIAAPKATEAIKYGIPTFVQEGNLVHFGGFKTHTSFFPASSGVKAFQKELNKYVTGKGTISFPLGTKIPFGVISRIVKFRIKENLEKTKEKSAGKSKSRVKSRVKMSLKKVKK